MSLRSNHMWGGVSCILALFFMVSCGIHFKDKPVVNYSWFSSHPQEKISILPFSIENEKNSFLAQALRRDFYLSLVNKNYPVVPLFEVDQNLINACQKESKRPEDISCSQLSQALKSPLIVHGELTRISPLYLLIYSHIKVKGRFWLIDYRTGEQIYYNEVSAVNRTVSPPFSIPGLATMGIATLSHLRSEQTVHTIRDLAERAVEPLPDIKFTDRSGLHINKIQVNVATRALKAGDIIDVEAWGSAGNTAWFDIGPTAQKVPMQEQSPGYYRGRYVVKNGDSVEYGLVRVALSAGGDTEPTGAVNFDTPLTIDADPPAQPFVSRYRTTKKHLILQFSMVPKPSDVREVLIYRAEKGDAKDEDYEFIGKLPLDSDTFIDKDIKPFSQYSYMAVAYDNFGNTSGGGKRFAIAIPGKGPTLLKGDLKESMVLMRYASPFFLDSRLVIKKDTTIDIEPGVEVYIAPRGGFYLDGGTLRIYGTEKERVRLYPWQDEWGGISTSDSRSNTISMEQVVVRKALNAVNSKNGNVSLSRVDFEKCGIGLQIAQNATAWIYNCRFVKNGRAILSEGGRASINHTDFIKNNKNIEMRTTQADLIPEARLYDVSAYLSGADLVPAQSTANR